MKLSAQQLEALKTMRTEMIPTDSPDHKRVSLNALEAKGLAVQVTYVSGTFFAISEKGRAFFNNQNKLTDVPEDKITLGKSAAKWVVCVIFALTATISYGQKLPDLFSASIGQTITLNDYKVVKDTVKSNLIISITGSPALIVTEGYVIREGLKFGGSWAMGNDGVYYKYIGYLDGDKNPFSPRTLVWQFKINE